MSIPKEDVSLEVDDVTVRKNVNDEKFETVAVVYTIRSGRSDPVDIEITDEIPPGVSTDEIEFHTAYGGDQWESGTDELTFSRSVEPGNQVVTSYGIENFDADESDLLAAPDVEVDGTGPSDLGEDSTSSSEDAPDDLESSVDALDGDQAEEELSVPATGGVARVLAKELRADNVDPEDRELLEEQLVSSEGSTDARIQRLQRQVADLEAYTGALEEFLDDEGGAEALIEDLRNRVNTLTEDLQKVSESTKDVEGSVDTLGTEVDDVGDRVDDLESSVDGVESEFETLVNRVEGVEGSIEAVQEDVERMDSLESQLQFIEDDIESIQGRLSDLAALKEGLSSVFGQGDADDSTDDDVIARSDGGSE